MLRENLNENTFTLIHNFSKKIADEWIAKSDELIFLFLEYNSNAARTLDRAREHLQTFSQVSIESGCLSFKMLNLILFNSIVGCNVYIESIDEIQGKKVISKGVLTSSMKELSVKVQEKIKAKPKFTTELPIRPQFSSDFILKVKKSHSECMRSKATSLINRLNQKNEVYFESEFDLADPEVKIKVRHKNTDVNLNRLRLKSLESENSI